MTITVPIIDDVTVLNEAVFSTGTSGATGISGTISFVSGVLYITTLVVLLSSFTVNVIVSLLKMYPAGALVSVRVYIPTFNPEITCDSFVDTHVSTTFPL